MKLRLNDKQVVNCKTEEEAIQCCQLAESMGLTWFNKDAYDTIFWDIYKEKTCYDFTEGVFCDAEKSLCYEIISTQDFITMHSEPFMGYFESDGTKETGSKILAVLKVLGGKNKYNYAGDAPMCAYLIDKNGEIDCNCIMKIPTNYSKCNLDHYLHLISEGVSKEERTNTEMVEELNRLKKENKELQIKADKWDAIPQYFCMRGNYERGDDIKKRLKDVIQKDSHTLNQYQYNHPEAIYFVNIMNNSNSINKAYDYSPMGQLLLATQTITELPPLEEKEEVEEFWLKPMDAYVWRFNYPTTHNEWKMYPFDGLIDPNIEIVPFTAETEPLIGTTDEPSKKYKFMGVKSYFNKE